MCAVFGGQHDALSPEARQGMALFFSPRAGCSQCHTGFNFSGNWRDSDGPTGEASFANNGASRQPMRVPTLRNIALTAPYMHDGRFPTLEAVVDHYAQMAEKARAVDTKGWSKDDTIDAILFRSQIEHDEFADRVQRSESTDPQIYVREASDGIFSLLKKEYAPADVRARAAMHRLEKVPKLLEQKVKEGKLGRKSGEGFYTWQGDKRA